jgi:phosphoribosyl-ATP pyrophosphohydrolase/phosphoribosyl-AMP cyclohydrolase
MSGRASSGPNGRASSDVSGRTSSSASVGEAVRFGPDGLVPAIVQDAGSAAVLMLGWMDREALEATIASGDVHFHSRSRGRLWRKGETSGDVLRVRSLALDCDADAILVRATPAGPTCHRGTASCFDEAVEAAAPRAEVQGFSRLETLWATIASRASDRPAGSYTAQLLGRGVDGVARKVAEEATEVVLAAKDDAAAGATGGDRAATRAALAGEAADLLYHLLVLLAERGLEPREVASVLEARRAQPTG